MILDTHIILWTALEPARLSARAAAAIERAQKLYCSAISVYEVLWLAGRGRVKLELDPLVWWYQTEAALGLSVVPITGELGAAAATLAGYPAGDPADRLIVATARHLDLPLCTADETIRGYGGVRTIW